MTSTLWLLNRAVAGGIAGARHFLSSLSHSLFCSFLISQSALIHCVWAKRDNMDTLGLFMLLILLFFQWMPALAAGKVKINIITGIM